MLRCELEAPKTFDTTVEVKVKFLEKSEEKDRNVSKGRGKFVAGHQKISTKQLLCELQVKQAQLEIGFVIFARNMTGKN